MEEIALLITLICSVSIMGICGIVNGHRITTQKILAKECTDSAKGLAICMIMASHMASKIAGGGYIKLLVVLWGAIGVSIFFLLSGYGNYFSTQSGAGARWLFRRIIHIFVPYTVSFIYLLAVYVFLFKQPFTITFVKNYFSLTIPYTSEWYLKVQILMYIFILISCTICIKSPTNYLFLLTLVYIALCLILKLPDYWWMTVMCFPLGFACAEFKSRIITILSSRSFLFTMGIVCTATLILRLKTESQPVILILYHILIAVFAISILVQSHFYSRALELLGKHSILVYLIHIGLVEMCFSTQFNIWLRAILYISLTFVGTVVCVLISDSLLKKYF